MANGTKTVGAAAIVEGMAKSLQTGALRQWPGNLLDIFRGSRQYYIMIGLFWLAVYAASIVALDAISTGYHHAYNATREIPWGLLISTYIFFVVTSTGLCIVSSIGHVFGVEAFMPIAKRAVFLSIVTICAGFVAILLEIENPFKMMLYNVLTPNLRSNIWWMGTLYGAYLAFMIVEFVFLQLELHKVAMISGFLGLVSGAAAHSNLGAIFGMLHGREFWYGPYMPIYFIVSAMMSGCAAIMLFTWAAYKVNHKDLASDGPMMRAMEVVSKLCILLIVVIMFFTTWKLLTGMAGGAGKVETLHSFLNGPYSVNFWGFEVILGMVVPLVLFLVARGRNIALMATASAMMLVGIFVMRYDLVVLGQVVSVFYEMGVNEYRGLLTYSPSWHEIGIVAGALSLCALTFLLGEKVFQGHEAGEHH
jgi:molybdopterin-containing oxidoreductase family membrane subunit